MAKHSIKPRRSHSHDAVVHGRHRGTSPTRSKTPRASSAGKSVLVPAATNPPREGGSWAISVPQRGTPKNPQKERKYRLPFNPDRGRQVQTTSRPPKGGSSDGRATQQKRGGGKPPVFVARRQESGELRYAAEALRKKMRTRGTHPPTHPPKARGGRLAS